MELQTHTTRDLLSIIMDHIAHYPNMEPIDLYKLIHQATCGGAHFVEPKRQMKKRLIEEWNHLDKVQKGERLLEVIDPEGLVIRVNLRVYKKIGGSVRRIFDVFTRSAEKFQRDDQRLIAYWKAIIDMSESEEIPFSKGNMEDLFIDMGKAGFPPVSHSRRYKESHRPAYRVIQKKLWEGFEKDETDETENQT